MTKQSEYLGEVVGVEQGHTIYFLHTSYNCPSLKMYGYRWDTQLIRAIRRKLAKEVKDNA